MGFDTIEIEMRAVPLRFDDEGLVSCLTRLSPMHLTRNTPQSRARDAIRALATPGTSPGISLAQLQQLPYVCRRPGFPAPSTIFCCSGLQNYFLQPCATVRKA